MISEEMDREWLAWLRVVHEWERAGFPDFNDVKLAPLIKAIESWGAYHAALRAKQGKTWVEEKETIYREVCAKAGIPYARIDMGLRTVTINGKQVKPDE